MILKTYKLKATDSILDELAVYVGLYKQSDGSLLDINTGMNMDSSHIVWAFRSPAVTGCILYDWPEEAYIIDDCTYVYPAICVA